MFHPNTLYDYLWAGWWLTTKTFMVQHQLNEAIKTWRSEKLRKIKQWFRFLVHLGLLDLSLKCLDPTRLIQTNPVRSTIPIYSILGVRTSYEIKWTHEQLCLCCNFMLWKAWNSTFAPLLPSKEGKKHMRSNQKGLELGCLGPLNQVISAQFLLVLLPKPKYTIESHHIRPHAISLAHPDSLQR